MNDPLRKLESIVRALRDPNTGCPWDKEQTHQSLRPFVIEEAYEVVEAIEEAPEKLEDELGDLLLQVFLHAQIASESERFSIDSIAENLSEKLVRRHPHVFGTEKAETAEDVKRTWEAVKKKERGTEEREHLLDYHEFKEGEALLALPHTSPCAMKYISSTASCGRSLQETRTRVINISLFASGALAWSVGRGSPGSSQGSMLSIIWGCGGRKGR